MEMFTLTYAELSGLVADLKAIGAHNASAGRRRGLMGKGAWARLERAYEAFRLDGRLPASYEVIYGHAWKSGVSARKTEASLHFVGRGSRA
jgi:malonyl-CoA O-methyltransferase